MQIIDVHCHVLPGVDDGASSMDESCRMLEKAYRQGVRAVIATPHSSMRHRGDVDAIRSLYKTVEKEFSARMGEKFWIYPGQEVFYRDSLFEELDAGKILTLADSSYVLVEFLPETSYSMIRDAARRFHGSGYRMILAHAERYSNIRDEEHMEELMHQGVYIQINARTIGGKWYDSSTRWSRKMLGYEWVHLIASDMHNTQERSPEYKDALEWMKKHLDHEYIQEVCWKNAEKIIMNQKI